MACLLLLLLLFFNIEAILQHHDPALFPVAPSFYPLGPPSKEPILKKPLIATPDESAVAALLPENEPKAAQDGGEEQLLKAVSNVDKKLLDKAAKLSNKFGDVGDLDVSEAAHSPEKTPIGDHDKHHEFHELLKQSKELLAQVAKSLDQATHILGESTGHSGETSAAPATTTTTAPATTTTTTAPATTATTTTTTTTTAPAVSPSPSPSK